jgi:hypothetical protein
VANRAFGPEFGNYDEGLSDADRATLVEHARIDLAGFRNELRDRPDTVDWDCANEALLTLRCFGKAWDALSPLLQALRLLPEAGVNADLRYWGEAGDRERINEPWDKIPTWIANTLYADGLRREMPQDPKLVGVRESFASYCLKRLTTVDTPRGPKCSTSVLKNEDFVEPSVWWRRFYAKAIGELRVNPKGNSHHILYWSSKNDPDELVSVFSKESYELIRHPKSFGDQVSPRRPLMAAFWWLRQAHRRELGFEVCAEGANSTRQKEMRRIKERDRPRDTD